MLGTVKNEKSKSVITALSLRIYVQTENVMCFRYTFVQTYTHLGKQSLIIYNFKTIIYQQE